MVSPATQQQLETRIAQLMAAKDFRKAFEVGLFGEGPQLPGYRDLLYRYLRKEMGDEESIEDVLSQALQNIWKGIETFRGKSSFRTWAHTILRHTLFRYWKEKANKEFAQVRIKKSSANSSISIGIQYTISESKLPDSGPSPSTLIRNQDQKEKLFELIEKLKPSDQKLMKMVLERGLSAKEIADELSKVLGKHVSSSTIRKRYERGVAKLKTLAKDAGYLWED